MSSIYEIKEDTKVCAINYAIKSLIDIIELKLNKENCNEK